jgi:alkylation response protein AidB-like acyl-CoA dehydrogenase
MKSATAPLRGEAFPEPRQASGDVSAANQEMLGRARQIGPLVRAEALNTETGGTLSPAAVDAMREAELFWAMVPPELGGAGCDLVTGIEILEAVSRADGSSGWSLMANTLALAAASAFAGDGAIDAMFGGSERPILAGMFGPGGKAERVSGGLRGSGTYSFGSGSGHANWVGGGMFVMEDGKPRMLPSGIPEVQVCFVPRDKVVFKDNWDVMGLAGTGSYDYEFPPQFIADDFTMERTTLVPRRGGPLFGVGLAAFGCAGHAAVALGIMRCAIEEIARIATTKKRVASSQLIADSPVFRHSFSVQEANYQAARGYVFKVFGDAQDTALRGGKLSIEQFQRLRQAVTWVHGRGSEIVEFCHLWSGSAALRNPSALGRCTRDMHGATQHIFVDQQTLVDAAPALLESWATAGAAE